MSPSGYLGTSHARHDGAPTGHVATPVSNAPLGSRTQRSTSIATRTATLTSLTASRDTASHEPVPARLLRALQDWSEGKSPSEPWNRLIAGLVCGAPRTENKAPLSADELKGRRTAADRVLQCLRDGERGTSLNLSLLSLSELPPGLSHLKHVRELDLRFNAGLTKLPDELADCAMLTNLRASDAGLAEVPTSLGRLRNLQLLDLARNPGLHDLPPELGSCKKLEKLAVNECDLAHLPKSLAGLSLLKALDVSDNPRLRRLPEGLPLQRLHVDTSGTAVATLHALFEARHDDAAAPSVSQAQVRDVRHAWAQCRTAIREGHEGAERARQSVNSLRLSLSTTHARLPEWEGQAKTGWAGAAERVEQWAENGEPVSLVRLLELNKMLGEGQPSAGMHGRLREGAVGAMSRFGDIASAAGLSNQGFYPPAAALQAELADFGRWMEQQQKQLRPDDLVGQLSFAVEASQRLVSIHPFEDGNGRTARLAADWLLQRSGLPPLGFGEQPMPELRSPACFVDDIRRRPDLNAMVEQAVQSMQLTVNAAKAELP